MADTNTEIMKRIDIGLPLANVRWENFAQALAKGETKSEAYRIAGFRRLNNAGTQAARLFQNVLVQERVQHIRDAISDEKIMTMKEIQVRLSEIGRATLKDYRNEKGVLDPFADGMENQAALAQVEQEYDDEGLEPYPTKIKLRDPIPAMDMLIKLKGGYPPSRVEVTGRDGGPIKTEDTRTRLLAMLGRISVRLEAKDKDEEDAEDHDGP